MDLSRWFDIGTTKKIVNVEKKTRDTSDSPESEDSVKIINVYTDGSTINNGQENPRGGVGVFFGNNDSRNASKKVVAKKITNNVCELYACILAIEIILESEPKPFKNTRIQLYSDSNYTINSIVKWAPTWEKNDYKGIKNPLLIKRLYSYYQEFNIKMKHVPAHKSEPKRATEQHTHWYGNKMADHYAKLGSQ
jgi:ribonuclease HI